MDSRKPSSAIMQFPCRRDGVLARRAGIGPGTDGSTLRVPAGILAVRDHRLMGLPCEKLALIASFQ